MSDLLITGGRLIDPASNTDASLDIAVRNGRIGAIGKSLPRDASARVIDAKNRIVCPGLIDPHVHLREPGQEHKETIDSGARAAAAGGFTSVCCMPNTSPALDSGAMIEFIARRADAARRAQRGAENASSGARTLGASRVFAVGAATQGRKGEALAEINLMARAGAVGFSDDGDCIASAGVMARALSAIAPTGLAFMQHAQEPTLTHGAVMNSGPTATRLGLVGWPSIAEEIIVERDVRLALGAQCRYHVQHLSSGGSIEILRRGRERAATCGHPMGADLISAEASPHHLLLTDEACDGYNTSAKMNPPLRSRADVDALRSAVAEGVITVLATDHAPHSADEKSQPFEAAPFGIIGLETALPLYIEALVTTGLIDWARLIALLTINPARLCNLDRQGLGMLKVGAPADITIIDPDLSWTISGAPWGSSSGGGGSSSGGDIASKCANTPFIGRNVKGRAVMTIVEGEIVMQR